MLLNCHTYFSYKFGTLSIEELIEEGVSKDFEELCLTDINSTSAVFDFIRLGKAKGIRPVIGIDFRNGVDQKYIGIARNNEGFRELNEHLTFHSHQEIDFENKAPEFENSFVIYPFDAKLIRQLKENEFIGIKPWELNQLLRSVWENKPDKLVILNPVTFRYQRDFNVHRLLRTIDKKYLSFAIVDRWEGESSGDLRGGGVHLCVWGKVSTTHSKTKFL